MLAKSEALIDVGHAFKFAEAGFKQCPQYGPELFPLLCGAAALHMSFGSVWDGGFPHRGNSGWLDVAG